MAIGYLLLVVILVAAQFLRRDPAKVGLQPMGGDGEDDGPVSGRGGGRRLPVAPRKTGRKIII